MLNVEKWSFPKMIRFNIVTIQHCIEIQAFWVRTVLKCLCKESRGDMVDPKYRPDGMLPDDLSHGILVRAMQTDFR